MVADPCTCHHSQNFALLPQKSHRFQARQIRHGCLLHPTALDRSSQKQANPMPYAGCSMDLIKCFNTIRRKIGWQPCPGVPRIYIEKWKHSLKNLSRTWCFGPSVTPQFEVNSGLCEGDPMSVTGMISIGLLWIRPFEPQTPLVM